MAHKAIAVFGTASDVGKSFIATALCRVFSDAGLSTAPFKAQNMSNNSLVLPNGLEIAKAQAIQAIAARTSPSVEMNPILLKPSSDNTSQLVIMGKVAGRKEAFTFFRDNQTLANIAFSALHSLLEKYEIIVIEGAGSCAEVNLMEKEFVNFKTAQEANASVILVADINRGGVFAQILGTLLCLPEDKREMIKGIIINGFRGDISLFKDGIKYIEEKSGIPVLGVLPYFRDIEIDYEDSIPDKLTKQLFKNSTINIGFVRLPHISNFTDIMALNIEPDVRAVFLEKPTLLDALDAVILPGSKNVIEDMEWLHCSGWTEALKAYHKRGGFILGICGGYQMLGKTIKDPHRIESNKTESKGLDLMDAESRITPSKFLSLSEGIWLDGNIKVSGYEIHMGETVSSHKSAIRITKRNNKPSSEFDGSISKKIAGTYLHGIFDDHTFRHHFLKSIGKDKFKHPNPEDYGLFREKQFDLLKQRFERYVDMEKLKEIADL